MTTIVAADLVGYSRLMAADEEGTITRLQGLLADVIRPEIATHNGRVVNTMGDGLLVEFPSTVAALKSTLAIQTRVAQSEADTDEDRRMRFRVGINLGDVVIDGDDILGDGVNIAARLESLAPPGGICLFQKTPDGARIEQSSRTAIRLSPRDPRVFTFHFMAGVGEWVKNGFRNSEAVVQSYRDACTHPNTDWYVYLGTALTHVNIGETDHARTYLNKALARNADLTMETYRTAFVFPAWPEWFEHNRKDLETLVEMGLPRE